MEYTALRSDASIYHKTGISNNSKYLKSWVRSQDHINKTMSILNICGCSPRHTGKGLCPYCKKPSGKVVPRDHAKLADFILFSQREFLLNLSRDLNKDNISFAQFFLLSYLAMSKKLMMTDIARKMGHSTAAATGLVDRLEKLGYMERTHAIDDRRKVLVRITAKGVDLVSRLRDELQSRIAEAMEETQTTDANSFITAYRKLDENKDS